MAWINSSSYGRIVFGRIQREILHQVMLTTGFWIAYVYLACLLILAVLRVVISRMVDFVGWSNLFGLRNAIARELSYPARTDAPFQHLPGLPESMRWTATS